MRTALIVEDTPEMTELLSRLIDRAFPGIELTKCASVEEAEQVIRRNLYNLALIDINLPDGCGTDLVRVINKASPDTYIVMATVYDDEVHLFGALEAGANGYLLKDMPNDAFVEKLRGIVNGDPPLAPSISRKILQHISSKNEKNNGNRKVIENSLSPREIEVLVLIAKGMSRNECAEILDLSVNTIARYIRDIYQKLDIANRAEAVNEAHRLGLIESTNGAPLPK